MKKPFEALALARGMSVLFMPSIHTIMLYSTEAVAHTWMGYILRFFAECVSAHLYMFLMGFFISVSRRKTYCQVVQRSLLLFSSGYLLNILRTYLPAKLGIIPDTFLHHYGAAADDLGPIILTGDILQFAGLAYLLTALVERCKNATTLGLFFFFLVALVSPFIWGIQSIHPLLNHGLALLSSNDTRAFFPLFPWLCYPLAGMVAGKELHTRLLQSQWNILSLGLGLVATGAILKRAMPDGWEYDFYRSGLGGILLHTGMVGLWLLFFRSSKQYLKKTFIESILLLGNRHLTSIYFIHWIIVGWGVGVMGYQVQPFYPSLSAVLMINLVSFFLIPFYLRAYSLLLSKNKFTL